MTAEDELAGIGRAVGWDLGAEREVLAGAASGSRVYRVRVDGMDAVLKVTTAGPGQSAARRELRFYQTLARQVPVTTPALLRHADDDNLTAILLSAHPPALPARDWDLPAWRRVAREVADLHSTPVPEQSSWLDTPWLQQILDRSSVDSAGAYWSRTEAAHRVDRVLEKPEALAAAVAATEDRFLHGDCHVGNLLGDGSRLVWADWQVAGVGKPAVDLAFLWSRAHADGAEPPYAAMVDEYLARSEIDKAALQRSLIAAELGVLLFGWPAFAAHRTQAERDRLTRRLIQLIEGWNRSA
ncbi:aminoglycoside phosphotransferase family protein [Micromonospora yasonensis]|uniref:aminoglycoside phosphotransferase family protein n=1 Tax=Micromonospora yasonensis TaxID=1128667 RepID=UPI00222FCD1F|nr:aminoglycoside phosphotransferase family protein [Micromonospora yasonensis]MCW3843902.1 aminoglycoside phosphotransferase family protein [Micromonospora yasonensis]